MKAVLGWRDAGTNYSITARDVWVRLKQSESNNTVIVYLHQNNSSSPTLYNTAPHYQWGRKDPFVPPKGLGEAGNETVYNASGDEIVGISIESGKATIPQTIQNPMAFWPTGESGRVDWLNRTAGYLNLWNYNQTATVDTWSSSNTVTNQTVSSHGKTVYDPCPAGYTVPNAHDFEDFQFTGDIYCKGNTYTRSFANYGWTFDSTFWPAMGQRSRVANSPSFTDATANYFQNYGYFNTSIAHGDAAGGHAKNCLYIELTSSNIHMTQGAKAAAHSIRCVQE